MRDKILLDQARTYANMYRITGENHYLISAWNIVYRIKGMREVTKELKIWN